jgi:hypothetical protein
MKAYAADNYTIRGVWLAVFGLAALLALFLFAKHRGIGNRFLLGYVGGVAVFFLAFSQNMAGHAYHQYPISLAAILLMAYLFTVVASNIGTFIASMAGQMAGKIAKPLSIALLILIIWSPSMAAIDRMFDTQFPGLDIAGDYLKLHKKEGERVMHSSHQAYGLLWHGDIKGTRGIPATLSNITTAEEKVNARWLFIYNWDFGIFQDQERWPYLSQHYSLRQVGFTRQNGGQPAPLYLLLYRDDKGFDINKLNEYVKDRPVQSREYEYSFGKAPVYYVNVDG